MTSSSHSFQALGTTWWIEIFDDASNSHTPAITACQKSASEFEENYSRFKPTSILSRLNDERTILNPSSELRDLLLFGQSLYKTTGGTFNILLEEDQIRRGYDADYSFKPADTSQTVSVVPNPQSDLSITDTDITLHQGRLDLGGFAKGYLIDRLSSCLHSHNINFFLINGGGDIYATSDHGEPITIYLEHPTRTNESIGETRLLEQGFASSSPFKRSWKYGNQSYSHIMTPEQEIPLFSSYVKATSAVLADAFATTALLVSEVTCQILSQQESLSIVRFTPETNELWKTCGF